MILGRDLGLVSLSLPRTMIFLNIEFKTHHVRARVGREEELGMLPAVCRACLRKPGKGVVPE